MTFALSMAPDAPNTPMIRTVLDRDRIWGFLEEYFFDPDFGDSEMHALETHHPALSRCHRVKRLLHSQIPLYKCVGCTGVSDGLGLDRRETG